MLFRRFFNRILHAFSRRKVEPAEPPEPGRDPAFAVDEARVRLPTLEPIARYLYQTGNFTRDHVRERAFLPPPDLRLSVFIVDSLRNEEIVEIGNRASSRQLKAYAFLRKKTTIETQGLTIERDDNPIRHAELCGWPLEKNHQKEVAQALAYAAELHRL